VWSTSEWLELAVWADELQRRGDAWGELIATSLALESASERGHAEALRQRLAELQRTVFEPRIGPLLRDHASVIHTSWEHGVLVGLRLSGRRVPRGTLERLTELLRLPVARFVWFMHINSWDEYNRPIVRDAVVQTLLEPGVVARPRVLHFGVHHFVGFTDAMTRLAVIERGLVELVMGRRSALPWARGDKGSRYQAMQRLHARVRARGVPLSGRDRTLLGRALWDSSLRVRIAALDCVAELGRDAAAFVPELYVVQSEDPRWLARREGLLRQLAAQPEVVECVRDNFIPEQLGVLPWLESSATFDDRALDRIAGMLVQPEQGVPRRLAVQLASFVQRHRPDFVLPEPPQLRPPSLFERVRAWFRG
jgi:hypothetical protein